VCAQCLVPRLFRRIGTARVAAVFSFPAAHMCSCAGSSRCQVPVHIAAAYVLFTPHSFQSAVLAVAVLKGLGAHPCMS
jgi:hypothetical protein